MACDKVIPPAAAVGVSGLMGDRWLAREGKVKIDGTMGVDGRLGIEGRVGIEGRLGIEGKVDDALVFFRCNKACSAGGNGCLNCPTANASGLDEGSEVAAAAAVSDGTDASVGCDLTNEVAWDALENVGGDLTSEEECETLDMVGCEAMVTKRQGASGRFFFDENHDTGEDAEDTGNGPGLAKTKKKNYPEIL